MASYTPTPDIPILVTSPSTSSERRITPFWTVSQLKQKLEFVTGIPPSAQRLQWKRPGVDAVWMDGDDEEIGRWGLVKGGEIEIQDLRPPGATATLTALTDPAASNVEKFTLPTTTYESLPNTVLSWKKTNRLGRFDPSAPDPEQLVAERFEKDGHEIEKKSIEVGNRCLVGEVGSPGGRRGTVRFVGPIEELPGGGLWIGVECDEPVGKNDGTVKGRRVFEQVGQGGKRGLFVRPERVEMGVYPPLEDLDAELGDEEEI